MYPAGRSDPWVSGAAYEPYVGRWSRLIARPFLAWLALPLGVRWLDFGCGTGALSQTILEFASPRLVVGIDPSSGFLAFARSYIHDPRVEFLQGDTTALAGLTFVPDVIVSGLVLNFVSHPKDVLGEMSKAVRKGGTIAAYVWDYAGQMQLIRSFWDAAGALDPAAHAFDEGQCFPLCQAEPLRQLFEAARLAEVEVRSLDVATHFRNFDDYWSPFLGGQGPAPAYLMSLSQHQRDLLRERLRAKLPTQPDGSLHLIARAWAIRGMRRS